MGTAEKGCDLLPQGETLCALVRGQLSELARLAQPCQVVIGWPGLHHPPNPDAALGLRLVQRPALRGEVLAQPGQRLAAPAGAFVVIQPGGVLSLTRDRTIAEYAADI